MSNENISNLFKHKHSKHGEGKNARRRKEIEERAYDPDDPNPDLAPTKSKANYIHKMLCKLAFLSGEVDKDKLMEIGKVSYQTLTSHWIPEFVLERKRMLLTMQDTKMTFCVGPDELEKHLKYVTDLRRESDMLSEELETVEEISHLLHDIVKQLRNHPDIEKLDIIQLLTLMRKFVTVSELRQELTSRYIGVTKEWSKAAGVEAYHQAASGRIKEREKILAKDDANNTKEPEERPDPKKGTFFDLK